MKISTLYLVPSYKCNLQCQHCYIRLENKPELSAAQYIEELKKYTFDKLILFGGEPLIKPDIDILLDYLYTLDCAKSCTTNMLEYNEERIDNMRQHDFSIATSWNEFRFTENQYKRWLSNIQKYNKKYEEVFILLTLTPDLIKMSKESFIKLVESWSINPVLQFGYLIDNKCTQEFYDKCNEWLLQFYNVLNITNFKEKFFGAYDRCANTYTLEPDGHIRFGCPNLAGDIVEHTNNKCLSCEFKSICSGGCRLQKCCTLSKQLAKIIGENNGGH